MALSLDLSDVPLYLNSSYAFGKEYQRYICKLTLIPVKTASSSFLQCKSISFIFVIIHILWGNTLKLCKYPATDQSFIY